MKTNALVTGGCGFIGGHLVHRLVDLGWNVDVVDDLTSGTVKNVPEVLHEDHLWIHDFSSRHVLDLVSSGKYNVVFHLAAVPRVSYSVEHPLETHDNNVTKTIALIDAAKGHVNRFIFASSSSVYGGASVLPTPETHPKSPKSPYALQKSIVEDYLAMYSRLYAMDAASLRFFNVFGPRQRGDSPYSTAVAAWLTDIKLGRPMRSDGDGSQSRDMCYVDNVVDALVLAGSASGPLGGDVFNVACGDRTTNVEVLQYLKDRYPSATSYDAPWRVGDVMHTQADITKIKDLLGYTPGVRFWEGLDRTIAWYNAVSEEDVK